MAFIKINPGLPDEREITLEAGETLIGRASENAVVIDNPAASSRHCAILRSGSRYTLRDMNSTNGTLLNGARVSECPLAPGDIISVGNMRILFDGDDINTATQPIPETGPGDTVRASAVGAPSDFAVRRSRSGLWIALGVIGGAGLLALIGWFVHLLFR